MIDRAKVMKLATASVLGAAVLQLFGPLNGGIWGFTQEFRTEKVTYRLVFTATESGAKQASGSVATGNPEKQLADRLHSAGNWYIPFLRSGMEGRYSLK